MREVFVRLCEHCLKFKEVEKTIYNQREVFVCKECMNELCKKYE